MPRLFSIITLMFMSLAALAAELKHDEQLIFFPTLGWRVTNGWELEIHGWVFEPEKHGVIDAVLRSALGLDSGEARSSEKAIFKERMRLFHVDNERSKVLSVQLGDRTHRLTSSAANGHFTTRVSLSLEEFGQLQRSGASSNGVVLFKVPTDASQPRVLTGQGLFVGETGLSVISDIDDTIKITQVREMKEMLRNTFCRPFKPAPGMAGAYQQWAKELGAQFHYVSASPWQLYPPLADFTRSNGFPAGSFHLKSVRVKDTSLLKLFESPERYKLGVIEPLMKRFPQRRFVLVGDSGEKDPEIYGEIARLHPGQVVRILIRDVTEEAAESERYKKAFEQLPGGLWQIFKEAREIEGVMPGK